MPIVYIAGDERYPDYSFEPCDELKPGRVRFIQPSGGWGIGNYVEMTEQELTDWRRTKVAYDTWQERIDGMVRELAKGPVEDRKVG
jgi:hypothetical protein